MNGYPKLGWSLGATMPAAVLLSLLSVFPKTELHAQPSRGVEESLQIIRTNDPAFPASLEVRGVQGGHVRVVINIDAGGNLVDWLVTSYSHRELADAAVAALKDWKYRPARQRGEPVGVRAELEFNFEVRGNVVSFVGVDSVGAFFERTFPNTTNRMCSPRDLDQPLTLVNSVPPGNPAGGVRGAPASGGSVLLDFLIDETGRPRMPVVLRSDHPMFSAAAVDALEQWRFAAPTRDGQPVVVRAKQEFVFRRKTT